MGQVFICVVLRWMRAVEEPTRYAKYKERKKRSERESDEASKSGAHPVDH